VRTSGNLDVDPNPAPSRILASPEVMSLKAPLNKSVYLPQHMLNVNHNAPVELTRGMYSWVDETDRVLPDSWSQIIDHGRHHTHSRCRRRRAKYKCESSINLPNQRSN
jgi:hypothetical protein